MTLSEKIALVVAANGRPFVELAKIAGLDPATDFIAMHYIGVDFSGQDLSGYNFTGAWFDGCRFEEALLGDACFTGARIEEAALSRALDWVSPADLAGIVKHGVANFSDHAPKRADASLLRSQILSRNLFGGVCALRTHARDLPLSISLISDLARRMEPDLMRRAAALHLERIGAIEPDFLATTPLYTRKGVVDQVLASVRRKVPGDPGKTILNAILSSPTFVSALALLAIANVRGEKLSLTVRKRVIKLMGGPFWDGASSAMFQMVAELFRAGLPNGDIPTVGDLAGLANSVDTSRNFKVFLALCSAIDWMPDSKTMLVVLRNLRMSSRIKTESDFEVLANSLSKRARSGDLISSDELKQLVQLCLDTPDDRLPPAFTHAA